MRKVRVESREFRRAIQGSNMSLVWLYSLPDESVTPSSPHTAVPFIYVFIGCFLYLPWPKVKPTTLVYWDNSLTNWAIWPGLDNIFLNILMHSLMEKFFLEKNSLVFYVLYIYIVFYINIKYVIYLIFNFK